MRVAISRLRASGIKHDGPSRYAVAVKEASKLGLSVKRPTTVVPRVEISEAIAMAGFYDAPYSLDRDCVIPPLPLQRLVFPMIEELYDDEPEVWRAHCDAVMMDPLVSSLHPGAERSRRVEAAQVSMEEYLRVASLGFIHVLLFFRRIVLQDAVIFISELSTNNALENEVFYSPDFELFSADLLKSMAETKAPRQAQVPALANSPLVQDGPRINGVTSIAEPLPRRNEPLPHQPERQDTLRNHIEFDDRFQAAIVISDDDESEKDLEKEDLEEEDLEEENLEEENLEAEEQDSVLGQDYDLQRWLDRRSRQQQHAHSSLQNHYQQQHRQQQLAHKEQLDQEQRERRLLQERVDHLEQLLGEHSSQLQQLQRLVEAQQLDARHLSDTVGTQARHIKRLQENMDARRQGEVTQQLQGLNQSHIELQLMGCDHQARDGQTGGGRSTVAATSKARVKTTSQWSESQAIPLIDVKREE